MSVKPISINNFKGGLNLSTSSDIGDNQFSVAKNMFYNQKGQIQTRYGIKKFGSAVGSNKPITSYFFFQRDDTLETQAICASGTDIYVYDETSSDRTSIKSSLSEFEKNIGQETRRTRRDFAVYRNAIYLTNGVDSYAGLDGFTPGFLTCGTGNSTIGTWTAITDGAITLKIDGTKRDISGINFSTGVTTMANVATKIQTAIRTVTSKLEIVVWSTDHFIITSANITSISEVSLLWSNVPEGTNLATLMAGTFGLGAIATVSKWNGTTYTEYPDQPKYRYINMVSDRLYGAGVDNATSSLFYSSVAPANGSVIDTDYYVIGGDELGRINGLTGFGNLILVMKSGNIYSADLTQTSSLGEIIPKATPIDSQTGGYSDRTIANVGNSLVYLTERGVDTLQQRYTSAGASTIESAPLDETVRELTTQIEEKQLNANCGWYIKRLGNYYFTFDTNGDNIPDTTLVYNAMVKAWTQYTYPTAYDYGFYINSSGEYQYTLASASSDQMYEIEAGFDDDGELIAHELKTKSFDFGEPGTFKTYEYIDVIGEKNKYFDIQLDIEVDGVVVGGGMITDDMIIETKPTETLGTRPIGVDSLTGSAQTEAVYLYQFVARIPLYTTGSSINFKMSSTGGTWILNKARIGVDGEPIDVFGFANIV